MHEQTFGFEKKHKKEAESEASQNKPAELTNILETDEDSHLHKKNTMGHQNSQSYVRIDDHKNER